MKIHRIDQLLEVHAAYDASQLTAEIEAQVRAVWEAETESRGNTLFNGSVFSVTEWMPDTIRGTFIEYRRFLAQQRRPDLFRQLRICPLAVSGMIMSPGGLIFGRRSADLTTDTGRWELAPSGGINADVLTPSGAVDYMRQFLSELVEELGIQEFQIARAKPIGLIEHEATHVFDIVISGNVSLDLHQLDAAFHGASGEYSELKLVPAADLQRFLTTHNGDVIPESVALLAHFGLATFHPATTDPSAASA